jgi:hypothetical protein
MAPRIARLVGSGIFAGVLGVVPSARAQAWATSVPLGVPSASPPLGDRADTASVLSGYRAAAPLRLSLEASVHPVGDGFPNCASLEDDAGNSVGGIPVQHYWMRPLVPRLVLSVFTQIGCPIDAGMGAALTYTVPVRESMWLVFGAGLYVAPGQLPLFGGLGPSILQGLQGGDSPTQAAGRADLVWKTKSGQPLNVGVETFPRRPMVKFGGGF